MRLPCPVGHYDQASIEGETLPPSLLTPPPVWTDVASCNIYTVPRTLVARYAFLGFLRQTGDR